MGVVSVKESSILRFSGGREPEQTASIETQPVGSENIRGSISCLCGSEYLIERITKLASENLLMLMRVLMVILYFDPLLATNKPIQDGKYQ
jgi:hypothetical protein